MFHATPATLGKSLNARASVPTGERDAAYPEPIQRLAATPGSVAETSLSQWLLTDLICKQLAESGVQDLSELAEKVALPYQVVEELLQFLRTQGQVEVNATRDNSPWLRFNLTERGHAFAKEASRREGYVGPAPITLQHYEKLLAAQSARHFPLTREQAGELFADTVIDPLLLDRLGPALHSGRAMFIYGPPGTGKSFIARRLKRALGPPILLPHALAMGDSIIRYFDPRVHAAVSPDSPEQRTGLQREIDPRLVLCERPMVVGAGELTMEMLDLQYNAAKRLYNAPLQLKANGGLLIIDDLGRQRISPEALLNRWILPMESGCDQLTLNSGEGFSIPFDLSLIFSTNLPPNTLADEAFIRRIGYKIRFREATPAEYRKIWQQCCAQLAIEFEQEALEYVIGELYAKQRPPLLPCHPRDLLQLALDFKRYRGVPSIDRESLSWAWQNYFLEV